MGLLIASTPMDVRCISHRKNNPPSKKEKVGKKIGEKGRKIRRKRGRNRPRFDLSSLLIICSQFFFIIIDFFGFVLFFFNVFGAAVFTQWRNPTSNCPQFVAATAIQFPAAASLLFYCFAGKRRPPPPAASHATDAEKLCGSFLFRSIDEKKRFLLLLLLLLLFGFWFCFFPIPRFFPILL